MNDLIKQSAAQIAPELVRLRRQIHQNPELAIQEFKTAQLVADTLRTLKLDVQEGIGRTGVVGLLRGKRTGKTVALRADMDALPVAEQNTHAFRSLNPNVMHACGHDAHTAILLGTAYILAQNVDLLNGNVKFIFQPSEESPLGGAKELVAAGVLKNPEVDAVFGLHVEPGLPTGHIGYRSGAFYAAMGQFEIEILGKGGHGARPHQAVDAILIAAEVVQALQSIASSKVDPIEPFVLTVGTIHGGDNANIIANKVTLTGTFRCFNDKLQNEAAGMIETFLKSITAAYGAEYRFSLIPRVQTLVNDGLMTALMKRTAEQLVGAAQVKEVPPVLLGEDFACYAAVVPGAFVSLGVGFTERENFSLHHPKFDLDEKALPIGAALLAATAMNFLNGRN